VRLVPTKLGRESAKIVTISNVAPSRTIIKQIRQFVDLGGYFRKFMQNFSKVVVTRLTRVAGIFKDVIES
jgi:hypothetical protein